MRITATCYFIASVLFSAYLVSKVDAGEPLSLSPFRLHLFSEPHGLDPQHTTSASSSYLFVNLFQGLYRYDAKLGLIPDGAEFCRRYQLRGQQHIKCRLSEKARWSDGTPVLAQQYVDSFHRLLTVNIASENVDLLSSLKNARAILAEQMPVQNLGVKALNTRDLDFELVELDPDFEYKLCHPALSPYRGLSIPNKEQAQQLITNGPFHIASWKPGSKVVLQRSPYFQIPHMQKSSFKQNQFVKQVEFYFVDLDDTALRLYEAGKLDFLRRVTSLDIARLKSRHDVYFISMARFDYIGFGPELDPYPLLREALSLALNYEKLQQLLESNGRPGCPSLPAQHFQSVPCLTFNPQRAKKLLKQVDAKVLNKYFEFGYSLMGGDDIARTVGWLQGQWQSQLGVRTELRGREQATYLNDLKVKPPAIFRKGIGLDRPTCLTALEILSPGNPENYLKINDPDLQKITLQMRSTTDLKVRRKLCTQALQRLLQMHRLIPLGPMHFTMLASPKFTGWSVNELNQLDLRRLEFVSNSADRE